MKRTLINIFNFVALGGAHFPLMHFQL